MILRHTVRLCAGLIFLVTLCASTDGAYQIGIGIADCTGPAAEIIFMGYAKLSQKGHGIHLRQWARAYIIGDDDNKFVFVSVDVGMIGYGMREAVIEKLSKLYGNTYNIQNVILSGTHTHSTPGGFMQHLLFDVTIMGFVKETFDALVEGITQAIINAHENMVPGRIYMNSGILLGANINRSPSSYLMNPESERQRYEYNVDKEMVQLKFVNAQNDKLIGLIHWFPVHPVSMNNTNGYISSDNVGYAAILMEKFLNGGALPGQGKIISAFASTNLGDVSPNIDGPVCVNTGRPCDTLSSSCSGTSKYCIASGPGADMFESTRIIAEKIYEKALEILNDANAVEITGPVRAVHQFVDMPEESVSYQLGNGTTIAGKGCNAAMGYSFAAGTIDGPGEFDFVQGTTSNNLLWDLVRDVLASPTAEDVACHAPKPILIATGQMNEPYEWQPRVVSTQLAMIGNVAIAAVPGEFTTMSGRRLKNTVRNVIGTSDATVIIAGLSNHYTDYIATYEEYQLQRYEGASTVYGPHTLGIYQSQFEKLARALISGVPLDPGAKPYVFNNDKLMSLVFPVILDHPDMNKRFGTCVRQPPPTVSAGDVVVVKFVSGHPRNNLMHGSTFLSVELLDGDEWLVVANDAVWETKYSWKRTYLAASQVTVEWTVPGDVVSGTYRIRHFGHSKSLFGGIFPYQGTTDEFQVV